MDRAPNIILIVADDMGYGDASCYGSPAIHTPGLDAMAAGGVRFTDFHSNGAVCSPTRAALLTGRYQQRCGIDGVIRARGQRHLGMPLQETTFAEVLKGAGYKTALFGKWHLGYERRFNPVQRGFDEFRGFVSGNVDYRSHIDQAGYEDWWNDDALTPEDGYTTDLVTEHGLRFIEQSREGPFCLYLAHECPHYPYQGPNDAAFRTPGNPEPVRGPRLDQDRAYVEMMQSMDSGIGRIVDRVRSLGLEDDTFIFFFSDNGPDGPGSSGPLRGRKATVWEGGHRVPAIAYWPGRLPREAVSDVPAMSMDLFPTLAAVAGVDLRSDLALDGQSLLPALDGEASQPDRALFWRHAGQTAARYGNWKLVLDAPDGPDIGLYDLEADLGEAQNLAGERPDLVASLRARLRDWESDVSSGPMLT